MSHTEKSYYITTAISYPNGEPHIGHGYEIIATDALARFKRLDDYSVYFLTGTDEHGQKMLQTARKEDIAVKVLADRNSAKFVEMASGLNCSHDDFIRTTDERHYRACEAIWKRMETNGHIYLDQYSGWYSVRDEAYYDEEETTQQEDGTRLGPQGTPVEWVEEESYFFRLSAFQDKLLKHYEDNPDFIAPKSRRNEVTSFVSSGLRDLSVSRTTFDWGIKVPGNDRHVMYVWVDALTNYITGLGFPDKDDPKYSKFWPADVHIIGKDIVRFHAVYWPAFLMAADLDLPKRIFAHGFLLNKGEKMSKSLGNVVGPVDMAQKYGIDQLRYFLLREVPFGNDGSYSHDAIVARTNADLANDFGNLAQRSLSMIAKHLSGRMPEIKDPTDDDLALIGQCKKALEVGREAIDRQAIHEAISAVWDIVSETNRYFASNEPWALKKTDPVRMETVLGVTADILRRCAILAQPYIPQSASKMLDILAVPSDKRAFKNLDDEVPVGAGLPRATPVFPRYVEPSDESAS